MFAKLSGKLPVSSALQWLDLARRRAASGPRRLVDLFLPDQCRICGAASPNAGYCLDCAADLPRHDRQCPVCACPIGTDGICGRCQLVPPPFCETIAPFRYALPLSKDIHQLKYHRKLACGRDLGSVLAREIEARLPALPDVLVPVPLHWRRQLRRGFNHATEIAIPISSTLGIPIAPNLVKRRVHTPPQVGLAPAQRRHNTRRAFECTNRCMPRSAAIVDDVVTSGSTVAEVARCLRRAGVEQVVVWALARA